MLYAFQPLLCLKLCRHNRRRPSARGLWLYMSDLKLFMCLIFIVSYHNENFISTCYPNYSSYSTTNLLGESMHVLQISGINLCKV